MTDGFLAVTIHEEDGSLVVVLSDGRSDTLRPGEQLGVSGEFERLGIRGVLNCYRTEEKPDGR